MAGGLRRILAAAVVAAVAGSGALARGAPSGRPASMAESCFDVGQHGGVLPLNDRTLLVRAGRDIYRVELAASCPGLTRPYPTITFLARGGPMVCGRLDYAVQVGQNGMPGVPCTVASQRRLTPAEVAALPPHGRP